MSYANAIIGLGVGIAAVILIIAIACYVIFSYAHMKALKHWDMIRHGLHGFRMAALLHVQMRQQKMKTR